MPNLADNINRVTYRIERIAKLAGRIAEEITLLAVSKGQPANAVRAAYDAGLCQFGENYVQEALAKMADLSDLPLTWHFIGPVQSNKTRAIAEHFAWAHSVDRLAIAERLSRQRPGTLPPLKVCLQVKLDAEVSKSGLAPTEVLDLARSVVKLPGLKLRGLMAIPAPRDSFEEQRRTFAQLADLAQSLRDSDPALAGLDTLSMGMSGDLEAAIAAGATIVRVGTDIFGPRRYPTATAAQGDAIER